MKRYFPIVLCLLTACGITPSKVDPSDISDQQSIVIISAGGQESCNAYPTGFSIYPGRIGATAKDPVEAIDANNAFVRSDVSGAVAHIRAFKLAPGPYSLRRIVPGTFSGQSMNNFVGLWFEVQPKEIVYVGNMFIEGGCHYDIISVKDEFDRDVAFVARNNPGLDATQVVRRPAHNQGTPGPDPSGRVNVITARLIAGKSTREDVMAEHGEPLRQDHDDKGRLRYYYKMKDSDALLTYVFNEQGIFVDGGIVRDASQ